MAEVKGRWEHNKRWMEGASGIRDGSFGASESDFCKHIL
jgi:hypothetical protein